METDEDLLDAWRGGDRRAGSRLLDRRAREITWFFRNKVFDESAVPDLVSQTFLGCVTARDRFAGDTSFRRFVYAIAHNVLREYLRTKAKRQREQLDFAQVCVHELDPHGFSSMVMQRAELAALVEGLRRVAVDQQVVLELKYLEGLKGREIAELLAIPEGTVKARLRRGLERLREQVQLQLSSRGGAASAVTVEDIEQWAGTVRAMRGP